MGRAKELEWISQRLVASRFGFLHWPYVDRPGPREKQVPSVGSYVVKQREIFENQPLILVRQAKPSSFCQGTRLWVGRAKQWTGPNREFPLTLVGRTSTAQARVE
ncbi:hypothetical protein AMTRI_Chr02g220900 [Amborella trichopoda]|uniref:Uncharacterized protein n=1 Tax=Amborella trichopoda TaxID=13333 RepID=W1P808_AMBTC|nr:hypothetical protein AMTR_s00003p00075210 [Amborella trichopoda]